METIGKRLRFLRDKHQLTQEKMAELIGKKKGNISNYESDNYEPSAQTIIAICKIFNVSADWLLFGKNNVTISEQNDEPKKFPPGFDIESEDLELLAKFHQLGERQKGKIEGHIDEMLAAKDSVSSSKQSYSKNGDGREEAASRTA
ncbi:helix-turn-helix domain-containing protein [Paenibacillus melissococcoides]|uniref:Helix-turn-helix domain-containing protein n=1 Tax=Paenibacillus melissococcoides TaxID=2912268 RepID=A0ABN8UF03_9BACL|nr:MULTISPECIES: helix-turn-helix domain-containing protein [Paenibacillus]MEB9896493.1 helix-turn-helix domain-containing protein [Bacillus cereus]CAH8248071.1 helix-turn-helix domain-containing protein [Paenibacillus melissococcoides]CAH8249817.1 helix-turn-helix domain-containing protein [Paenibacillus melissococcoides]CAH8718538.1 helix-turn-helix domain-containing protein [Paenibacillus melissococcoides]CAH8718575.1 helix-turn-helix domain-containing protein [Paenibacillus melissococcoide